MNGIGRYLFSGLVIIFLLFSNVSFAETTCTKGDCELTITLKLAFQGATQAYMNNAKNEIESVWNGPGGFRTVGDCKCKMKFVVQTTTAQDCKNNPPAGYHCIMVTSYFKPNGQYDDPPRNQTNMTGATFYVGYMYGIATGNGGNSQTGWWSDIMSRPVDPNNPQGEHYKDFAHEAGHMMGLEDGDGGIMSRTSGANSGPTQANLDEIADEICGPNSCPDRCCCGNGKVDRNKGEQCDPKATPVGCGVGQSCCPTCCNCYGPICIPGNGEYFSQSACQMACGANSKCYKNYKTGCWDCLRQEVVVHETCYDTQNIRGNEDCDHVERSFVDFGSSFYEQDLVNAPVLGGLFQNERINVVTDEGDFGNIVAQDGEITQAGGELLTDHTVTLSTDRVTMEYLASGDMSAQQALAEGRIRIDGNGFFDWLRFGAFAMFFNAFNLVNPAAEFEPPAEEPDLPQEYYDMMDEIDAAGPLPDDPEPSNFGELPDGGYFGEDIYPEFE